MDQLIIDALIIVSIAVVLMVIATLVSLWLLRRSLTRIARQYPGDEGRRLVERVLEIREEDK